MAQRLLAGPAGKIQVATPSGALSSNVKFRVRS